MYSSKLTAYIKCSIKAAIVRYENKVSNKRQIVVDAVNAKISCKNLSTTPMHLLQN